MPDAQARNIVERLEVSYREIATYCAVHPSSDITKRAPEHMALYQDAIAEIDRLTEELTEARAALKRFLRIDGAAPEDEDCPLCDGIGELSAYVSTSDKSGADYVGCPECLARYHDEVARAALSKKDEANE